MQSALKQSEDLEVNVAHQDANQAWPALVAKAFGADFHNIAWSGAGVVWNAGAGCSADVPFHDLYFPNVGEFADTWWNWWNPTPNQNNQKSI